MGEMGERTVMLACLGVGKMSETLQTWSPFFPRQGSDSLGAGGFSASERER